MKERVMVTFSFALDTVMQLPQEQREDLIEIVSKRQAEEWRKEVANSYKIMKEEISNGKLKPVSYEDAIKDLHDFVASAE